MGGEGPAERAEEGMTTRSPEPDQSSVWPFRVLVVPPLVECEAGESEGTMGACLFCEATLSMSPRRILGENDRVAGLDLFRFPLWLCQFDGRFYLMPATNQGRQTYDLRSIDQASARGMVSSIAPPEDHHDIELYLGRTLEEFGRSVRSYRITIPDPSAGRPYAAGFDGGTFGQEIERAGFLQVIERDGQDQSLAISSLGLYATPPMAGIRAGLPEMQGLMNGLAGLMMDIAGMELFCDPDLDEYFLEPLFTILDGCIGRFHEEQRPLIDALQSEIDALEGQVSGPQAKIEEASVQAMRELSEETDAKTAQIEALCVGRYKALGVALEEVKEAHESYVRENQGTAYAHQDELERLASIRAEALALVEKQRMDLQYHTYSAMTSGDVVYQTSLVAIQASINNNLEVADRCARAMGMHRQAISRYEAGELHLVQQHNQIVSEMERTEKTYNSKMEATIKDHNERIDQLREAGERQISKLRAPITERESKIAEYRRRANEYIETVERWKERFVQHFSDVLEETRRTLDSIVGQISVEGSFDDPRLNGAINLLLLPVTEVSYARAGKDERRRFQCSRMERSVEKRSIISKQVHLLKELDVGLGGIKDERLEPFLSQDLLPKVRQYYPRIKEKGIIDEKATKHIDKFLL